MIKWIYNPDKLAENGVIFRTAEETEKFSEYLRIKFAADIVNNLDEFTLEEDLFEEFEQLPERDNITVMTFLLLRSTSFREYVNEIDKKYVRMIQMTKDCIPGAVDLTEDDLSNIDVHQMYLSTRCEKTLERNGVRTVAELHKAWHDRTLHLSDDYWHEISDRIKWISPEILN